MRMVKEVLLKRCDKYRLCKMIEGLQLDKVVKQCFSKKVFELEIDFNNG